MTGETPPLTNAARRKLTAGEPVFCLTLRHLVTPDAPMIARACGFDAFYVDCEHGTMPQTVVAQLCIAGAALGITPFVRVRSLNEADIAGAFDAGAHGVIVPHVATARDAAFAIECAKLPPRGHRSVAAQNPLVAYAAMPIAESIALQNRETMVIAMLESAEGIANADAIAAVDGVDVLMIGSTDLSAELGIPGQTRHPKIVESFRLVAAAARKHGKHLVGGGSGGPELADVAALGARFIMGGTDVGYFMAAARQAVAQMRNTFPQPRSESGTS